MHMEIFSVDKLEAMITFKWYFDHGLTMVIVIKTYEIQ